MSSKDDCDVNDGGNDDDINTSFLIFFLAFDSNGTRAKVVIITITK